MIAVDTNILVYAYRADLPFHPAAVRCLTGLAEGPSVWGIPWSCAHEFLSVVTNPRVFRIPTPAAQALAFLDVLRGMEAALRGRNGVSAPAGWTELETTLAAAPDEATRRLARNLGTVFGSPRALETLRTIAANPQAAGADRTAAVYTLLRTRDAALVPLLQKLTAEAGVRATAIRGLAAVDDAKTPSVLLAGFQHIIIHQLFQIRGILGVDDPIKPAFWQSIDPALVVNLQFVPQQNHFGQILFQNGFGQLYNLGIGTVYKAEDGFIQILCPSAYFVELIHGNTTE